MTQQASHASPVEAIRAIQAGVLNAGELAGETIDSFRFTYNHLIFVGGGAVALCEIPEIFGSFVAFRGAVCVAFAWARLTIDVPRTTANEVRESSGQEPPSLERAFDGLTPATMMTNRYHTPTSPFWPFTCP
ncbi:MAG: hypothetical protein WCC24_22670 [Terracidiphilus sp.]